MEGDNRTYQEKEEICIHVVHEESEDGDREVDQEGHDLIFNVRPFRQMFFRYSIHGQSEVVRSSSLVYASHHSSATSWLDIRKLSFALVGSKEVPNLALFSPTVNEIYVMGHISFPSTVFKMLPQLTCLKTVNFNLGLGGNIAEFHETAEDLRIATPEAPWVTSLEIKMNHHLYNSSTEEMRSIFKKIIVAVLKYSRDSFPNLENLYVDIPNSSDFLDGAIDLVTRNESLSRHCEIKVDNIERKIEIVKRPPIHHDIALPFDPCARFPTFSEYNDLRRVNLLH